jgi:hypothetical protein
MAASPDATATKPPTVLAGRSAYYGAILYLGDALGEFWPTVLFQAAIFLLSVGLSLVNLRVFSWARFLGVTAFLALCTPVAFFNSFLMPDVFAGFCVLAAANLLAFEQRMGVAQRVYWFIVLALGMLFHSSHLLIAGGILAAWGAWAIWNRRSVNFVGAGIIGLALVTGAAGEQAFNIAVTKLAGNAPIRPPFLMARVIADGPGTAYLRANCPGAKFVICRYVDRLPPQSSDVFLWADDPKLGVFMAEDEATKRALSAEQFRFAAATIAYDPAGYARKSLDNIWEQLSTFRLDEFNYTDADLARFAVKVPEPYRSRIAETPAARAKMPVGGFDALAYTVVALSIALLIYSVIRRRPAYVSRRIFVFSAVIIVGLLLNGVICALMSMPHARYEARVIWLVPALVLMLELRAGERLWALPQLIARIRRS